MGKGLEESIFLPDKSLLHRTFGKDVIKTCDKGTAAAIANTNRTHLHDQHHRTSITHQHRGKSHTRTSRNTKHHSHSTVNGVAPAGTPLSCPNIVCGVGESRRIEGWKCVPTDNYQQLTTYLFEHNTFCLRVNKLKAKSRYHRHDTSQAGQETPA
jgi:hypothetical protein